MLGRGCLGCEVSHFFYAYPERLSSVAQGVLAIELSLGDAAIAKVARGFGSSSRSRPEGDGGEEVSEELGLRMRLWEPNQDAPGRLGDNGGDLEPAAGHRPLGWARPSRALWGWIARRRAQRSR